MTNFEGDGVSAGPTQGEKKDTIRSHNSLIPTRKRKKNTTYYIFFSLQMSDVHDFSWNK